MDCLKCVYIDEFTGKCKVYNNMYCCNGQCYFGKKCCMLSCEMLTPPESDEDTNADGK